MPFRSEAQRRYLWANHPEMAREWAEHTPKGKKLPEHVEKDAMFDGFFSELEKMADLLPADVLSGAHVAKDIDEALSKVEPGDIIATKPSGQDRHWISKLIRLKQRMTGAQEGTRWSHVGVATGGGNITHAFPRMEGGHIYGTDTAKMQQHSLKELTQAGNDFIVLRPQVPDDQKLTAIDKTRSLEGVKYDRSALVRAGLLPRKYDEGELKTPPSTALCTGATAYAYGGIDFDRKKSIRHLLPIDIIRHPKLTPIVAYAGPST